MASGRKTIVIACGVLREDLERIKPLNSRIVYLPQSLHRTPKTLAASIQKEMDAIEPGSTDTVLVAYGLCSNGIVGVKATRAEIIIPRVHDCIGIFLGSLQRYMEEQKKTLGPIILMPAGFANARTLWEYWRNIGPISAGKTLSGVSGRNSKTTSASL